MDSVTRGLGSSYGGDIFDPHAPWWRTVGGDLHQRRLFPARGGGRRIRHPFFRPLVYPLLPARTINFVDDPVRRTRAVVTKTLGAAAADHFQDPRDGTVISEIWSWDTKSGSNELTTLSSFFRALLSFRTNVLPAGRYLGWQPRDLSPKNFFIQLLDVRLGTSEDYTFEELGDSRPYYMREVLTLSFKLVREAKSPTGVAWAEGV